MGITLTPCSVEDVPRSKSLKDTPKHKDVIQRFVDSGSEICEVSNDTGAKNVKDYYACLTNAAKRGKFPVRVIRRGERIFLARKEVTLPDD